MPPEAPETEPEMDILDRIMDLTPPPATSAPTDSTWIDCPDWSIDLDRLYGTP